MNADSGDNLDARPALQHVLHYPEITKHHFQSYAQAPGSLDWAAQKNWRCSWAQGMTTPSRRSQMCLWLWVRMPKRLWGSRKIKYKP